MANYNDQNTLENLQSHEVLKTAFISIPVYYSLDEYGQIHLWSDVIEEEFQRTVYGIETLVDEYNENLK
jgi:hypothetical protein